MTYRHNHQRQETSSYDINYDDIISLPTDDDLAPTPVELEIVNTLFKENKSHFFSLFNEIKEPLLVGLLYIIFNLEYITNIVHSLLPFTRSSIIFTVITKGIIFMLVFWIIKHLNFAKKEN